MLFAPPAAGSPGLRAWRASGSLCLRTAPPRSQDTAHGEVQPNVLPNWRCHRIQGTGVQKEADGRGTFGGHAWGASGVRLGTCSSWQQVKGHAEGQQDTQRRRSRAEGEAGGHTEAQAGAGVTCEPQRSCAWAMGPVSPPGFGLGHPGGGQLVAGAEDSGLLGVRWAVGSRAQSSGGPQASVPWTVLLNSQNALLPFLQHMDTALGLPMNHCAAPPLDSGCPLWSSRI